MVASWTIRSWWPDSNKPVSGKTRAVQYHQHCLTGDKMYTSLMTRFIHRHSFIFFIMGLFFLNSGIHAEVTSPYGVAGDDQRSYSSTNIVFDVYCQDPEQLTGIFRDLDAIMATLKGHVVVVIRGAEIAVFARKNYSQYRIIVDRLARLSSQGVQFRIDRASIQEVGLEAMDMHGFSTVVPSGLAEIAAMQNEGSKYVQFTPHRSAIRMNKEAGNSPDDEGNTERSRFKLSM